MFVKELYMSYTLNIDFKNIFKLHYFKTLNMKLQFFFTCARKVSFSEKSSTRERKKPNLKPVWREACCTAIYVLFWAPEQGTMHHFSGEQKIPSLPKCWERWQLQNRSLRGQVACRSPNRKWTIHADFNV